LPVWLDLLLEWHFSQGLLQDALFRAGEALPAVKVPLKGVMRGGKQFRVDS
jgi:hypothetical protein